MDANEHESVVYGVEAEEGKESDFQQPEPATLDDLRSLMERAKQGDARVLPELEKALDEHPEIWQWYGDIAAHAEAAWTKVVSGSDLALAESLKRRVAALKTELVGPSPTPLERLLVERVTASYLEVTWAEAVLAQAATDASTSMRQAAFAQQRVDRAQRRHLAAMVALSTVRRLRPAAKGRAAAEREECEDEPANTAVGTPHQSPDRPLDVRIHREAPPVAPVVGTLSTSHTTSSTSGPGRSAS